MLKQFISAQVVQQVLIFVCSACAAMVTTQWNTAIMNNIEPPMNLNANFSNNAWQFSESFHAAKGALAARQLVCGGCRLAMPFG